MISALAAWTFLALAAAEDGGAAANLLKNGGFEAAGDGAPAHWALFVAPAAGAFGRHEPEGGRDGGAAVLLHTPLPYASDPLNNWSQVVEGPFTTGQKLHFRGAVRTQEATEAFHLIQAWRRRPGAVVGTASTRQDLPHGGTRDWTELATTFEVPPQTDFIVVRCVLLGVGSAWFDACYLGAAAPPDGPGAKAASTEPAPGAETVPETPKPPAPVSVAAPPEELDALEAQVKTMRDSGESMRSDMYRLRETNEALRDQLEAVRRELEAVRETLRDGGPAMPAMPEAPEMPDTEAPERRPAQERGAPPLVPSHLNWEAL